MAVSLNGDGTITGLSTLSSVTITGLTSLTTTDLTADTTTLVVDSANNRVGIGTASPSTTLQVVGTATATAFSGPLTGNVTGDVSGNAGTVTNGVYTTDIGSTVQAYDADLTTLAGLSSADGNFIVGSATGWVVESGATARTSLGLGTAATTASTDYATAAQGSLADSALQSSDIGSTVQAYDADTAKYDDVTANFTGTLQQGGSNVLTGNQTITLSGDASGSGTTSITVTVADDSHNHIIGNVDGLQTALDNKQPLDADLTTLAGLSSADGNFIVGSATGWVVESGATVRTSLGLGTAATTASTDYATAAQGTTADSALQPGDNISTLTNNSGFITGNQTITLSGDLSGSGTTSITTTLGTVAVSKGGTGQTTYTNGQLLIGNSTGNTLTKATLTAGSGISVTNGAGAITIASTGGGGFSNVQTFTSPGTWTNPGSVTKVKVTVIGGGGGGSGSNQPNANVTRSGAGGGGGGTAIEWITIPTSPVPVTIGAGGAAGSPTGDGGNGGTSSFGAYCSATGGTGGDCQPSSPGYPTYVFGGIGGAGSGGNLNLPGQTLGWHSVGSAQGQSGGQSILGTGGMGGQSSPRGTKGAAGNNYGGGGGGYGGPGGAFYWTGGGAGASGVVVVEW